MKLKLKYIANIVIIFAISKLVGNDLHNYFWEIPECKKWYSTREIIDKIKANDEEWLRGFVSTDFNDDISFHTQLIASIYLLSISENLHQEYDAIGIILRSNMAPRVAFNLLFESINPHVLQRINYLNVLWIDNNIDDIGGFNELSKIEEGFYFQVWNDVYEDLRITQRKMRDSKDSVFPFDDYTLLKLGMVIYRNVLSGSILDDDNGKLIANSFGFVVKNSELLSDNFRNLFLESLENEFGRNEMNDLDGYEIIGSQTVHNFTFFLRPYRIDDIEIGFKEVLEILGLSDSFGHN